MSLRPCTAGFESVAPDQASLQSAVDTATDGNVICLAAGTPIYTTTVDITAGGLKALEIRGAGSLVSWGSAGQTIITMHTANAFGGFQVPASSYSPIVANIRFLVDASSPASSTVVSNAYNSGGKPFIAHHNDFFVTGMCDSHAIQIGHNKAVIYRNRFTSEALASCSYGFTNLIVFRPSYSGDAVTSWESASTCGSADTTGENNSYFETNYISGFLGADNDTSARVVWRFNEMHNSPVGNHGYDSSITGLRHQEVYNNTFLCDAGDGLGHSVAMSNWTSMRGGTGFLFSNVFPATDMTYCGFGGGGLGALALHYYKAAQSTNTGGWPGAYPDTYPATHQPGWGWISGSNQTVGSSTAQNQPGGSGYQQALEPIYAFHNTNNTGASLIDIATGYIGEGRAMAYPAFAKSSGASLDITGYLTSGQVAFVTFADLVGGSAPTITDDCGVGQTWTAVNGATLSGMRLSGWAAVMNATCRMTATVHFTSSSAARAGVLVAMRGMTTTPVDRNPAVRSYCPSGCDATATGTYTANSTTALSQPTEIVLGYYALNGPTVYSISGGVGHFETDSVDADTSTDSRAISSQNEIGGNGITGTTGGADNTNVTIGVTYRTVSSTAAVTPAFKNNTASRDGLAGAVSFMGSGAASLFDLQVTDLIQHEIEVYSDNASFIGATGTGYGDRLSRPATCATGVAYWSTDQGSWNTENSTAGAYGEGAGQGVLDKCTDGANGNPALRWTNAWYVPYEYPHRLATETGEETEIEAPPTPTAHRALLTF